MRFCLHAPLFAAVTAVPMHDICYILLPTGGFREPAGGLRSAEGRGSGKVTTVCNSKRLCAKAHAAATPHPLDWTRISLQPKKKERRKTALTLVHVMQQGGRPLGGEGVGRVGNRCHLLDMLAGVWVLSWAASRSSLKTICNSSRSRQICNAHGFCDVLHEPPGTACNTHRPAVRVRRVCGRARRTIMPYGGHCSISFLSPTPTGARAGSC